jgi:hypothetical protein
MPLVMTHETARGSRGQLLKTAEYLADGRRLVEAVDALRAARAEASVEEPVTQPIDVDQLCNKEVRDASAEAPVTKRTTGGQYCNEAPVPTKRKSYRLPPLDRPSVIPGFPLRDPAGHDMPNYGSIERRGKRATMKPTGPSSLRKVKKQ